MSHSGVKESKFSRNKALFWALTASLIISGVLFSIRRIAVYEWDLADLWSRQNYASHVSDKVAVVGIDDDLFAVHKYEWPLEKDVYGELLMYLQEMGAKVITFDIEFSHNFQQCGASDSLFRGMISTSPDIVIGYGFIVQPLKGPKSSDSTGLKGEFGEAPLRDEDYLNQIDARFAVGKGDIPIPGYQVTSAEVPYKELEDIMQNCGFFNRTKQMSDGVDRLMPLLIEQDSLLFASLALSSVQRYVGDSIRYEPKKKQVTLGKHSWQVNSLSHMAVNFTDSIPVYTMSDVMISFKDYLLGGKPEIGKKQLEGRIVFIGSMLNSSGDLGVNPVSSLRDAGTNLNGQTPMVMLHAYAANTMLEDKEILLLGRSGALALTILLVTMVYLLFRRVPQNYLNIILPILFALVYLLGWLLFRSNVFLPIVEALSAALLFSVAGVFINYYDSNREYRYISSLFRTYISPELIEEMARTHSVPKLGGELIEGTAFFTDIEKFSTFSEIFTPEELIQVLNEYFSKMTVILKNNKGTLDKFIGDAIVAIFGAPYYFENNAEHACSAAWNMQQALAELRAKWGRDPILCDKVGNMHMRIGINSGPFIVGHLGCEDRMNYTMIGDTVNLAARLESGAKQYGVYTLVGESTYESAKKCFLFRAVDRIVVMGRREPVSVYELIAPLEQVTEEMELCCSTYSEALESYISGDFSTALRLFEVSEKHELSKGKVTPSSVMTARCRELSENRPEQWDGVYTMNSK